MKAGWALRNVHLGSIVVEKRAQQQLFGAPYFCSMSSFKRAYTLEQFSLAQRGKLKVQSAELNAIHLFPGQIYVAMKDHYPYNLKLSCKACAWAALYR